MLLHPLELLALFWLRWEFVPSKAEQNLTITHFSFYDLTRENMVFQNQKRKFFTVTVLSSVLVGLLPGCAKLEDRVRRWFSSSVDVFAVMDGKLLVGQAHWMGDRNGSIRMQTEPWIETGLACSGQISRTGTATANLWMQCNDSKERRLPVAMLAETQGYAYGAQSDAVASSTSLTLGLSPEQAISYLRPPAGQTVVVLPDEPYLQIK
jgi:hypothetical protein